jgi:hypothetical protein
MAGHLAEIHDGFQQALSAIDGLLVADHIPEKIIAPMVVVSLEAVDAYAAAMGQGMSDYRFVVTVVVKRQATLPAQLLLDDYLSVDGARSIHAALTADRTLGGACLSLAVESAENIRPIVTDDGQFLAADVSVRVHA